MKRQILVVLIILGLLIANLAQAADPQLKWSASVGDVDGYRVYYGTAQGEYTINKDVGNILQVPLSILGLESGIAYYFIVRAYNNIGESPDSMQVSYILPIEKDEVDPLLSLSVEQNKKLISSISVIIQAILDEKESSTTDAELLNKIDEIGKNRWRLIREFNLMLDGLLDLN